MTGYQEILTDPSYNGQIVTMTNPQIGNYGVNDQDAESRRPWVRGFVIRELSRRVSNHRATGSLSDYLEQHGIIGIEGIDTRALVRLTRERGAMKGILSTTDPDDAESGGQGPGEPGLGGPRPDRRGHAEGVDILADRSRPHLLAATALRRQPKRRGDRIVRGPRRPHVVALDFGMKWNILRHLVEIGCQVTVMPG